MGKYKALAFNTAIISAGTLLLGLMQKLHGWQMVQLASAVIMILAGRRKLAEKLGALLRSVKGK